MLVNDLHCFYVDNHGQIMKEVKGTMHDSQMLKYVREAYMCQNGTIGSPLGTVF